MFMFAGLHVCACLLACLCFCMHTCAYMLVLVRKQLRSTFIEH